MKFTDLFINKLPIFQVSETNTLEGQQPILSKHTILINSWAQS